jgi:hypothetical protein
MRTLARATKHQRFWLHPFSRIDRLGPTSLAARWGKRIFSLARSAGVDAHGEVLRLADPAVSSVAGDTKWEGKSTRILEFSDLVKRSQCRFFRTPRVGIDRVESLARMKRQQEKGLWASRA